MAASLNSLARLSVTTIFTLRSGPIHGGVVTANRNERVYIGQEDWNGKRLTKLVDVPPMTTMHRGWYHTGAGSPRSIARLFSGVSYSPDGQSLVYCSNQPSFVSPSQAGDRLAQLLEENGTEDADALAKSANALVGQARGVSGFRLFTIGIDGSDPQELTSTNTDWPTVVRWGSR